MVLNLSQWPAIGWFCVELADLREGVREPSMSRRRSEGFERREAVEGERFELGHDSTSVITHHE